jgi:antitoxin component of MazEF toxin-antitoxin module
MSDLIKFVRKIRVAGGSLAITIPPEIQSALGLKAGQDVEIFINGSKNIEVQLKKK